MWLLHCYFVLEFLDFVLNILIFLDELRVLFFKMGHPIHIFWTFLVNITLKSDDCFLLLLIGA